METLKARIAVPADAERIANIYNQGIEDRIATFETRLRTAEDIRGWFDGRHPIVVVEERAAVRAFAATFEYRPRACYAGVAEFSVYVDRDFRRRGAGRLALIELLRGAEGEGFWKLVSRIFPENIASLALVRSQGFREVGTYEKHGQLDSIWRDVVIVERLIGANFRESKDPCASYVLIYTRQGSPEGAFHGKRQRLPGFAIAFDIEGGADCRAPAE
jgi:L-amino acid N-acyltransferase YncA